MEVVPVQGAIHVGIGKKDFRNAGLKDHIEKFRAPQFVERLCREHHRGVVLAPGLKRFDDIFLDAGILEKYPSFIDEEGFENLRNLFVADNRARAVQDIEEQGLQNLRVLAHVLEIEALKSGKGDGVCWIIEKKSELSAADPFGKALRQLARQGVREHTQGPQWRVHDVKILNLVIQLAFHRRIQLN